MIDKHPIHSFFENVKNATSYENKSAGKCHIFPEPGLPASPHPSSTPKFLQIGLGHLG